MLCFFSYILSYTVTYSLELGQLPKSTHPKPVSHFEPLEIYKCWRPAGWRLHEVVTGAAFALTVLSALFGRVTVSEGSSVGTYMKGGRRETDKCKRLTDRHPPVDRTSVPSSRPSCRPLCAFVFFPNSSNFKKCRIWVFLFDR